MAANGFGGAAVPVGDVRTQQRQRRWHLFRPDLAAQRARVGLLLSMPLVLIVVVFFAVPLFLMIWMAFNNWPLFGEPQPNGGQNFSAVTDQLFLKAVLFTVTYAAVTTVVLSAVAMGLALLVQVEHRGVGFMRTSFFLPSAVGFASTCYLFYAQFQLPDSPLNIATRALTSTDFYWLGTTNSVLWSMVGMIVWRFGGFYMLILLTGLQSITGEVYEAARIDGASWLQTFVRITVPLMRQSLALMLILSVTGSLLVFEPFYIITQGRPDNTTVSVVVTIYRQAFVLFDLGRAAALSAIVLSVLLLVNGTQLLLLRQRGE